MPDLGKAYVQIVPSAKGISGGIQKAIGPEIKSAGIGAGRSLSSTIGAGLKSIGAGMTSYITKPALAAVAALGGATLFSGWKRMTEIDNAKVKLEAIGNTTKDVAKIQENAMEAVKGTAYGMDAAMTTSAAAVAAGIKPGKELTQYLTAISDASAVAGTDMASMGSIFNKVATSGKAQNDVLGQLADSGIPIYQYLADQMGVTADKVFDMARAGEIGLADFQAAVTNHIGGAAKEIGSKTITGAISNVKAAISRIGANFLGSADDADSFAGKILPMLNNLMKNLGPVEEKAKELGAQFADAFGKFAEAIGKVPLPVLAGIAGSLVSIGPAISIFTTLSSVMSLLGVTISAPVAAIGALAAALALAYTQSETFRNAINQVVVVVAQAFAPLIPVVTNFLKVLIREVVNTAKALGDGLAPILQALKPVFAVIATLVAGRLKMSFTVLKNVIKVLGATVRALINIFSGTFMAVITLVKGAYKKISSTVKSIIKAFDFGGLVGKVTGVFNSIKEALSKPIEKAKDIIKSAIEKIKGLFPLSIGNVFSNIKLPRFNISGGTPPFGIGGMGTKPSISVSWYAKGGIMNGPTLFGGGEKGPEAIVPLDPFWKKLDKAGGNTFNVTMNVNGAEDPEAWADRFMSRLQMEARMA